MIHSSVIDSETIPLRFLLNYSYIINCLSFELNMKYSDAPLNVSLCASSLFVLHYNTQPSGTTEHSVRNEPVRLLGEG